MGSQRVDVPGVRVLRQKREMGRRERSSRATIVGGRGEFDQRCGEKCWGVAGRVGLMKKIGLKPGRVSVGPRPAVE